MLACKGCSPPALDVARPLEAGFSCAAACAAAALWLQGGGRHGGCAAGRPRGTPCEQAAGLRGVRGSVQRETSSDQQLLTGGRRWGAAQVLQSLWLCRWAGSWTVIAKQVPLCLQHLCLLIGLALSQSLPSFFAFAASRWLPCTVHCTCLMIPTPCSTKRPNRALPLSHLTDTVRPCADSVQWRQSLHGFRTLCHACGIAWVRGKLKMPVVGFTPSVLRAVLKSREAQKPKGACKVRRCPASLLRAAQHHLLPDAHLSQHPRPSPFPLLPKRHTCSINIRGAGRSLARFAPTCSSARPMQLPGSLIQGYVISGHLRAECTQVRSRFAAKQSCNAVT